MTDIDDYLARTEALKQQLRDVHGIRARDLPGALRKARRDLPKALRKSGFEFAAARAMIGHPKLEMMMDFADLRARHDALSAHLDQVDVADVRRGRLLAMLGRLAFYFIVIVGGYITWAVWAGHL